MMRRPMILFAVLGLLLAVAVPVSAAPVKSSLTYHVDCGDAGHFTVLAKGTPGFPTGDAPPVLLLGGHFTVTEGGQTFTWHDSPPPGLESKLTQCRISGPAEDVGFSLTVDPAWVFIVR